MGDSALARQTEALMLLGRRKNQGSPQPTPQNENAGARRYEPSPVSEDVHVSLLSIPSEKCHLKI